MPTTAPVVDPTDTAPAPSAQAEPKLEPAAAPEPGPTLAESTSGSGAPDSAVATGPLAIDFTYAMQSGGKQLNPYIAVWIEDQSGRPLRTIALWLEQSSKGTRWLDDLRRWWRGDQDRQSGGGADMVAAVSSATRAPGAYSLLWDGLDDAGNVVTDSQIVVCIESARERGPYSLICADVEPARLAAGLSLPDDGELSGATVNRV